MNRATPITAWRRLLAMPNESLTKTLVVALLVAFTASVLVSVTAVLLAPKRAANQEAYRQARMQQMIASLPGLSSILGLAGDRTIEPRLVDLSTGQFAHDKDPTQFDPKLALRDPTQSIALAAQDDVALIGRRANYSLVHLVRNEGEITLIVLPVYGTGYQSMLRGYLALRGDTNTVAGLTFYEQRETAGVGDFITDPDWTALWAGKSIADADGNIVISVAKGSARSAYEVDGVSGATRTGSGVTNMLRFWLGANGFGPFLERLRSGDIRP